MKKQTQPLTVHCVFKLARDGGTDFLVDICATHEAAEQHISNIEGLERGYYYIMEYVVKCGMEKAK